MEAETPEEALFGDWLLRKLREHDMSLSDVARLAQCDYTYLWRLVNVGRARGRQYRRPSYAMAERVGRALNATHEALTAAGYLPAENLQNSRVVDALDRVERQLCRLREELSPGSAPGAGAPAPTVDAGCRVLPLIESEAWPDSPEASPQRIELPGWLAGEANWAVRVGAGTAGTELRAGDLALIRQGTPQHGQLAAVLRDGKLEIDGDARMEKIVGTMVAFVRCYRSEG